MDTEINYSNYYNSGTGYHNPTILPGGILGNPLVGHYSVKYECSDISSKYLIKPEDECLNILETHGFLLLKDNDIFEKDTSDWVSMGRIKIENINDSIYLLGLKLYNKNNYFELPLVASEDRFLNKFEILLISNRLNDIICLVSPDIPKIYQLNKKLILNPIKEYIFDSFIEKVNKDYYQTQNIEESISECTTKLTSFRTIAP